MVREIVTWCSVEYAADEREPGQTRNISIDGEDYEVDLCDTCDKEAFDQVREFLVEYAQSSSSVKARRRDRDAAGRRPRVYTQRKDIRTPVKGIYVCPFNPKHFQDEPGLEQDCAAGPFVSRAGVRQHLDGTHGRRLGEMEDMVGELVTDDPKIAKLAHRHPCGLCDDRFPSRQAADTHRYAIHHVTKAEFEADHPEPGDD
jgi:hypothetical protein